MIYSSLRDTREYMIHIFLPVAIILTNQSHCFSSHGKFNSEEAVS